MIENKTVSAVLFVYNEERYITQMLNSILNQTVKVDSIIVIDDFSTDNTRGIVEEYQKKYPFIEYYLNDKKGKINAYQKGLQLVKTDLFFISAGDDVLVLSFVEKMYNLIGSRQAKFAYANCFITDENLTVLKIEEKKEFYSCKELIYKTFANGYLFGYSSIIKLFIPLPKELLFEDWYTCIKLSSILEKCYISEEPLWYYRRHSRASTAAFNTREKYYFYLDRDIRLFEVILQEGFINDPHILQVVKSRLLFLRTLRKYTFIRGLKNSLDTNLTHKERSKMILFPLYFGLKYK